MIDTQTTNVLLIAHTEEPDGPAVAVFGGEVIYGPDGTVEGCERGDWWESLPIQNTTGTPVLDQIDAVLTDAGYTRTTGWHGPCTTESGVVRYYANGTTRIEIG
jgi:hypothetical protein